MTTENILVLLASVSFSIGLQAACALSQYRRFKRVPDLLAAVMPAIMLVTLPTSFLSNGELVEPSFLMKCLFPAVALASALYCFRVLVCNTKSEV